MNLVKKVGVLLRGTVWHDVEIHGPDPLAWEKLTVEQQNVIRDHIDAICDILDTGY